MTSNIPPRSRPPADQYTAPHSGLATLQIELLGGFRVRSGSVELPESSWRSRNATQLVKRLALAPGYSMLREGLVDLLWPNADVASAANSLRQALHVARRMLRTLPVAPDLILRSHGEYVELFPAERTVTDVRAFEEAVAAARSTNDPTRYWEAITRYSGPLLPRDEYEDWTLACRESLAASYANLLEEVSSLHEERGERSEAIGALQRLIAVDPTREAGHVRLMRLYADAGDRLLVMAQYQHLAHVLASELDIAPNDEAQTLYDEIRSECGPAVATTAGGIAFPESPPRLPATNLPHPISSFIGREREVEQVVQQLSRHRLVSLIGPGGTGKTRLALEAAWRVVGAYPDGTWFVPLANITDPSLVPQAVADVLGIEAVARRPIVEALIQGLRGSESLLILDNCEHLIGACAELIGTLLNSCSRLRVLTTSRETLRISGERPWAVPALDLPDPSSDFNETAKNDAVRLFVDRVGWHRQGFRLTPENAPIVATICRRLDGLPLAVELAAARGSVLSLNQLASRLDDALGVLTSGTRRAPTRQQTLRATLDWSYALLDDDERRLFRRLAVFASGWTLNMAEAICTDATLPSGMILAFHGQLASKSLVQVAFGGDEAHYRLLEPVKQYAAERLEQAGERDAFRERHAEYFAAFLERIEGDLSGPNQVDWLNRLDGQHDDLRGALGWAIRNGRAQLALRIEAVLWRFWGIRWHSSEGLSWVEETITLESASRTSARARAMLGAGELARRILDFDRSIALHREALEIHRETGDKHGIAWSLAYLASALGMAGRKDESRACIEESLALFRNLGDKLGMARTLNALAEDSRLNDDYETAARSYREALELDRGLGDQQGMAVRLHNLGYIALHDGDVESAARFFCDSFSLDQELGYRTGPLSFLEGMAATMSAAGRAERSARIYGAWEANCSLPGTEFKLHPPDQKEFERYVANASDALGQDRFQRAWSAGRRLTLSQAVDDALAFGVEVAGRSGQYLRTSHSSSSEQSLSDRSG